MQNISYYVILFFKTFFLIGLVRGVIAYYRPNFHLTYFRNRVTHIPFPIEQSQVTEFSVYHACFSFLQQAKEKAVYRDTYSLVTTLRFLYHYPPSGDSFEQRLNDSPCSNRSEDGNKSVSG